MTYSKENLLASMQGEQNAFALLYEEIYPDLYRMAIYMCGDRVMAEDLVSETTFAAYKGIHQLQSVEAFEVWIFKILSSTAKRTFKKNYNSFSILNPKSINFESIDICATDATEDGVIKTDILNAMSILKPIDRVIISLCILEGYKSQEAGEILSMNATTIRSRLNRSLKKLKKELEGNGYE